MSLLNILNFERSENFPFYKNLAMREGLSSKVILKIISQIESTENSVSFKCELMQCLIPKKSIPEEAFIRMTCLLSDFNFCLNLKVEILKWMISVHCFLENSSNFLNLYEILFHLLEYEELLPYVCHLLFIITKPEHVTVKRKVCLAALLSRFEPQSHLTFLLFYFCKLHSRYDIEPKSDVKCDFEPLGIYPKLIKDVHPSYETFIPTQYILNFDEKNPPAYHFVMEKTKPVLSEAHFIDESSSDKQSSDMLSVDGSTDDLQPDMCYKFLEIVEEMKSMKKPTKVKKILDSKFRRLILSSNNCSSKKTSIDDFILISMYINMKNTDILQSSIEIFHDMQKSVPGVSDFIEKFIECCNGSSNLSTVMKLLSYVPICCFYVIDHIIDTIQEKILNPTVFQMCDIISGLSNLYKNWVLAEYKLASIIPCEMNCSELLNNASTSETHSVEKQICLLGNFIDFMCDTYLLQNDFHLCLVNEVLLHYERVSMCHVKANLVILPPTTVVFHAALFSLNYLSLDNLCALMLCFHREVCVMNERSHPEVEIAAKYFMQYYEDIIFLLKGNYVSNKLTHLSKEGVIQTLKKKHANFEKFFQFFRHPALFYKTTSFMQHRGFYMSPTETKSIPEHDSEIFKYLSMKGLDNLVKCLSLMVDCI